MYVPLSQKDEPLLRCRAQCGHRRQRRSLGTGSVGSRCGGNVGIGSGVRPSAAAAGQRSQLAEKCWPVVLFIAGSEAASEASATEE